MRRLALLASAAVAAGCGASVSSVGTRDLPEVTLVRGCDPLYYERSDVPDVVIASDLPLNGNTRTAMLQMTQAIKLAVKDRDFRAGAHSAGYVSCSDSGPTGAWSPVRCRANARALARTARVVAFVGTRDSRCTRIALPILARAGIAVVAPLNAADDLGGRTFFRLVPSDAQQADALAAFASRRGHTVAVVDDGTRYGASVARDFRTSARRLGLREARAGADAVFVGGALSPRTRAVLADAREHGRLLLLPEGFGPAAQLAAEAGQVAEGAFLAVGGVPVLRPSFAVRFERVLGQPPHPFALYAGDAAQRILDAIAVAGPSRVGVARRLRESGAFDAHGDPVRPRTTIYRIVDGSARMQEIVDSGLG